MILSTNERHKNSEVGTKSCKKIVGDVIIDVPHYFYTFYPNIREVQPYNRTTTPKDSFTGQDAAKLGSEFIGTNDLYLAATGEEPFSGET